jgi:hypothetical protein
MSSRALSEDDEVSYLSSVVTETGGDDVVDDGHLSTNGGLNSLVGGFFLHQVTQLLGVLTQLQYNITTELYWILADKNQRGNSRQSLPLKSLINRVITQE